MAISSGSLDEQFPQLILIIRAGGGRVHKFDGYSILCWHEVERRIASEKKDKKKWQGREG